MTSQIKEESNSMQAVVEKKNWVSPGIQVLDLKSITNSDVGKFGTSDLDAAYS